MNKYLKFRFAENYNDFTNITFPYIDSLYNYAYILTYDNRIAAELLRKTMIIAFRLFDMNKNSENMKVRLFYIMRKKYLLSKTSDLSEYEKVETANEEYKSIFTDYEKALTYDLLYPDVESKIKTTLALLSEELSSMLYLCDKEEWPIEDLAELFDISIEEAKTRIFEARIEFGVNLIDYARESHQPA